MLIDNPIEKGDQLIAHASPLLNSAKEKLHYYQKQNY
jgi:hypothetical protein